MVAPITQAAAWLLARPSLPHALEAPRRTIATRAGLLACYEDDSGGGTPVLLLHSVGATGCAYEVHGVFEALRGERSLVAVELPGYGFSREGTARGSDAALATLVEELVAELGLRFGERIDVVAFGRTGLAAADAARRVPHLVRSVVLVSPPSDPKAPGLLRALVHVGSRPLRRACATLLAQPPVGALVHRVVTSRPVLELALGRRARELPRALVHHAWSAARQPNAHVAPVGALCADLTSEGCAIPRLAAPTLIVLGAAEVPAGVLRSPLATPGRTLAVVPGTKALPHVERPFETAAAMRAFWTSLRPKPALRLVRGTGSGARVVTPARRPRLRDVAPDSARRR